MHVENSQWLYRAPATLIRETATQFIVDVEGKVRRFWKSNGLELGFSETLRAGCNPTCLVGSPNSDDRDMKITTLEDEWNGYAEGNGIGKRDD